MVDTSFDREQFFERELTTAEIEHRKSLTLDLLSERDDLITAVDERRREIRALNASRRKLEARTAQVRREIRSGKVLEPRQTEFSLPPPEEVTKATAYDRYDELYPIAETTDALHVQVFEALNDDQLGAEWVAQEVPWEPGSEEFIAVANWARLERAHLDSKERGLNGDPPIAGLTIPAREQMPLALRQFLEIEQLPKAKRKAKATSKPKGKRRGKASGA